MFIWKGGFRYKNTLRTAKTRSDCFEVIKKYFTNKTLIKDEQDRMLFSGGHNWVSKYISPFMIGPESWLAHEIEVKHIEGEGVHFQYTAKCYFVLLILKVTYQKEMSRIGTIL